MTDTDAPTPDIEISNTDSLASKVEPPDTNPPTPSAQAPNANPKIPAPPGNLINLRADTIETVLQWLPDDHIIANKIFRNVYAQKLSMYRQDWLLLPKEAIEEAVEALAAANPRLFSNFEDSWYQIWGLYKRHTQRLQQTPPGEVGPSDNQERVVEQTARQE